MPTLQTDSPGNGVCFPYTGLTTASLRDIRKLCAYWQKQLRLQDWDIVIHFGSVQELDDAFGDIDYSDQHRRAIIRVMNPKDLPKVRDDVFGIYDIEFIIVHELLHLHYVFFMADDGTQLSFLQEQTLNAIARALVAEHRQEAV